MENVADDCSHAGPDQVCPVDESVAWLAPIVGLGTPLLLIGLGVWLAALFYRQLKAGQGGLAAIIVIGGYLALSVVPVAAYGILLATYPSWGMVLIFASLNTFAFGVFTAAWLIALIAFAIRRRSLSN